MKQIIPFAALFLSGSLAVGQQDSLSKILGLNEYIELVAEYHPVVKQAALITEAAEARVLQARGGFDPKISSSLDLKNFKGREYYDIFNTTLKFQTIVPIDPKISLNRNEGLYLNPERSIPESNDNRQVSAGLSIPIGKGLFMDERRLALRQAKIYQNMAGAERTKMVNKAMLRAIKDYWQWYTAFRKTLLLEESVNIAQELFDRVLIDFEYGELSVIDTVQAKITFQTRQADYEKALFELENSRLMLSNHLWSPNEQPLELQVDAVPDRQAEFGVLPSLKAIEEMIDWAEENHPEIQKLNNKIDQYRVENRWYRESLKPRIDLSYAFVDAPVAGNGEAVSPSIGNNYKLGLDFSFPIFLRKERGKLQQNKIKIRTTGLEQMRMKLAVRNSILNKYEETKTSSRLAEQFSQISNNYKRLLDAEFVNLDTGESDLFKLNLQQDKFIAAQIKHLEYQVKYQKNKVEILHESGRLFSEWGEFLLTK